MFYFTSDTHYGHVNIIEYCDRPFARDADAEGPLLRPSDFNTGFTPDIEAMNEALIERWNRVVTPKDHVFHLGDFAMGPKLAERVTAIRKRLNGLITLVRGNHDRSESFYKKCGFEYVGNKYQLVLHDGVKIWMRHHPPATYAGTEGCDLFLCGHVHEKWKRQGKIINVGVDQWDFTPRTLEELLAS